MKKLTVEERKELERQIQEDDVMRAFVVQLRGQLVFLRRDWGN